jgi:hypothetical protein
MMCHVTDRPDEHLSCGPAKRKAWDCLGFPDSASRRPGYADSLVDIDFTDARDHVYQSTIVSPGILENSLTLCVTSMA